MRILYSAIDQEVPGPHGGSVHVIAVAEGLSALGHEVRVLVHPAADGQLPAGPVMWEGLAPPLGSRRLRLVRARAVLRRARAFRPDVVIERYYNFGGEGLIAARRVRATAVLEVNAPVADYPGSLKQWLDRLMLVEPMRRWRDWQCRNADVIVAPSRKMLPSEVPASRVLQIEWGADIDRFRPDVQGPVPFVRTDGDTVAVFAGAFRPWHGAVRLVEAIRRLRERGRQDVKAVLVGEGPELARVKQAALNLDGITITGALPHAAVPPLLAAADIGVAPFDLSAHSSLLHEFHWSPLKVFEYMASGLPVAVPTIDRLSNIVRHDSEGLMYDAANRDGLADVLERLTDDRLRRRLGAAARARVVEHFSWKSHCKALDHAIRAARDAHSHRH